MEMEEREMSRKMDAVHQKETIKILTSTVSENKMELSSVLEKGPLPPPNDGVDRTGTVWTCVAHIIAAVIGSGVLSLAWAVAQLGWAAAPPVLVTFAAVTFTSAFLLSECYRSPDPVTGERHHSYMQAVGAILGKKRTWACGLLQYVSMYGIDIAYTITTSISMRAILRSNCYHKEGHGAKCQYGTSSSMLIFGAVQLVCSQIPDFQNMAWLSSIAAAMSFSYSSIGLGLGIAKVIGNGGIKGSIAGVTASTTSQRVWKISQALGDIAFSYPYSFVLIEIQDTLKSPPSEHRTMKRASMISVAITTFFYLCCGCFGYAAFGEGTPGNIMTGFGFYEPFWLIDFANACIILHLVGSYQVFSQPIFAFADRKWGEWYPARGSVNRPWHVRIPLLGKVNVYPFRLCFRTLYVGSTTGLAMLFPYFNQVLGVIGALIFWPLAIYFPVEMYISQKRLKPFTRRWVTLEVFNVSCLLVSSFMLVGSLEGIIREKLK
ncbi:putative amino acid permease 7 isoform X2 [Wolffia australiana]